MVLLQEVLRLHAQVLSRTWGSWSSRDPSSGAGIFGWIMLDSYLPLCLFLAVLVAVCTEKEQEKLLLVCMVW
jgi:hypothetical protein